MHAVAIHSNGNPLTHYVGFLNGIKIQIQCPGGPEKFHWSVYSVSKRFHSLGYQTITTPDRFTFNMYELEVGRLHETVLYRYRNIHETLHKSLNIHDEQFYVYTDQVYILWTWLQIGYNRNWENPERLARKIAMNEALTAVKCS